VAFLMCFLLVAVAVLVVVQPAEQVAVVAVGV
jgi:hypothetical protein